MAFFVRLFQFMRHEHEHQSDAMFLHQSFVYCHKKIFYVQALLPCVLYTAMNQRGTTGDSAKTYLVLPPDHIEEKSSECTMSDLSTISRLLLGTQCVGSVGVAVLIRADSVFRFLGVFFSPYQFSDITQSDFHFIWLSLSNYL